MISSLFTKRIWFIPLSMCGWMRIKPFQPAFRNWKQVDYRISSHCHLSIIILVWFCQLLRIPWEIVKLPKLDLFGSPTLIWWQPTKEFLSNTSDPKTIPNANVTLVSLLELLISWVEEFRLLEFVRHPGLNLVFSWALLCQVHHVIACMEPSDLCFHTFVMLARSSTLARSVYWRKTNFNGLYIIRKIFVMAIRLLYIHNSQRTSLYFLMSGGPNMSNSRWQSVSITSCGHWSSRYNCLRRHCESQEELGIWRFSAR